MQNKVALIFGISGQDGSYLSKILLKKNYIVHGVIRRSSSFNTSRIEDVYVDPHYSKNFFSYYGDLTDTLSINNIISKVKPARVGNRMHGTLKTSKIKKLGWRQCHHLKDYINQQLQK